MNHQLCKGCGFCVKYCPRQILETGEAVNAAGYLYAVQIDQAACTGCGTCAAMCPDAAINVYRE